jgi:hypothetical protein
MKNIFVIDNVNKYERMITIIFKDFGKAKPYSEVELFKGMLCSLLRF